MPQHPIRPENRRRGTPTGADWADTLPSCFRSEGFAEDLHEVASTGLVSGGDAAARRQWVARTAQSLRGVVPGWRRPRAD